VARADAPLLGELAEMSEDADGEPAGRSPRVSLLLALAGVAIMTAGGRAAVAGAIRVVDLLHVSDNAVGLTFLALATTAELFALVWAAARRGATEIAVGGLVGSAAYNATATLGVAALVRPLSTTGLLAAAGLLLLAGYAAYAVAALT